MQVVLKVCSSSNDPQICEQLCMFVEALQKLSAEDCFRSQDALITLTQVYRLCSPWISDALASFPWSASLSAITNPLQSAEMQKKQAVLIQTILQNHFAEVPFVLIFDNPFLAKVRSRKSFANPEWSESNRFLYSKHFLFVIFFLDF